MRRSARSRPEWSFAADLGVGPTKLGLEGMSPDLRKRMQGKSCFNFKSVTAKQAQEVEDLTRRSVQRLTKVARLRGR